jgi:hypothetical protein
MRYRTVVRTQLVTDPAVPVAVRFRGITDADVCLARHREGRYIDMPLAATCTDAVASFILRLAF